MLRDKIKTEEYFEEYIIYQKSRIEIMADKVLMFTSDGNQREMCLSFLSSYYKDYINALYSYGESYEEIKTVVSEYIKILSEIKVSSYSEYIDAVSMSIIFDIDITDKSLAENYMNDRVVNMLLNSDNNNNDFYPSEYKVFSDYLEDKISTSELKKYMSENWYYTCKDLYWYNSHLSDEKTYSGYWCWIAGACLKLKNETDILMDYVPCFK